MTLRFRKSFKLAPGVRINLSKSGTSVSLGGRGLTYNVSKKGTRTTVGISGTGISDTTYKPFKKSGHSSSSKPTLGGRLLWIIFVIMFFAFIGGHHYH